MRTTLLYYGRRLALLAVAAGFSGCEARTQQVPMDEGPSTLPDGAVEVLWNGRRVTAQVVDGRLLVEGDIVLWPEEVAELGGGCDGETCAASQAVRIQGASRRWTNGVVPFVIDASFVSAADRTAIQDAMDDWEAVVPGLRFRDRTASDGSWIRLMSSTTECSSGVGKPNSGENQIRLTAGCVGSFSLHHEIGHALGLYHQHTRKDRDSFVTINWANIQGCRSTATSMAQCGSTACSGHLADCGCTAADVTNGVCYMAHNFDTNASRADIGDYDYDSMMHYSAGAFAKAAGLVTIAVPAGAPAIGQRNHISGGDRLAMNTMYPVLAQQNAVFADSGNVGICTLDGRKNDIYSEITTTINGTASTNLVNTANLTAGTELSTSCRIRSVFWASNYDYPNSSVSSPAVSTFASSDIEVYSRSGTLTVLDLGLVPALL